MSEVNEVEVEEFLEIRRLMEQVDQLTAKCKAALAQVITLCDKADELKGLARRIDEDIYYVWDAIDYARKILKELEDH